MFVLNTHVRWPCRRVQPTPSPAPLDFSDFYVYFAHIRLVEYDYWEQFESIQRLGEWCCQSGLVREFALQGVVLNASPPHGNAPLVVGVLGPGYHSRYL